jgi:dienelactone hydrolase
VLAVAVAATTTACTSSGSVAHGVDRAACRIRSTASGAARDGPVTVLRVELVDRTRPTPATAHRRARPCRVLPTEVWLPTRPAPDPLVVMAHGLDGDPDALRDLAETWARAGYDVAAPMFPTTVKDATGNSARSETALQAGDLRFVVDRMLVGDHDRRSPWFGRIDPARIGAAGMSLGGLAVYATTTESCCTDRRIDAAILMAAVYRDVPDSEQRPNRVPMMLVQGDADPGYHNSRDAYSDLVSPKWFVTLHGARHGPPFESPRGPEAAVVDATTIAFWDATLHHDPTGGARIVAAVRAHRATTSLQDDPGR